MAENGAGNVTLYVMKFSPYAWRPQISLADKGIAYTPVTVDLANKPKEFLEANPVYGKVPVLVHNGNPICESAVILEYIEEAWPEKKPLMPKNAVEKSKVRFWTDYIYKGLLNILHTGRNMVTPGAPSQEASLAEISKFFKTLEATMVDYSADGPYFTGDQFGYLDVVLVPLAAWIKMVPLVLQIPIPGPEELPRLYKWVKDVKEYKAVRETIPSDDEVTEYWRDKAKWFREKLQAEATNKK